MEESKVKIQLRLKGKCKFSFYFCVVFIFFFSIFSLAQSNFTVFVARNNIGAIKVGYNSNILMNQKYILLRNSNKGPIEVGVVEVVQIKGGNAGIRLIENRNSDIIQPGDYLGSMVDDTLEDLFGNEFFDTDNSLNNQDSKSNFNNQPDYNQNRYNQVRDANSQEVESKQLFPNFTLGGALGYFVSSGKNFDDIYGKSGGFSYGSDASIHISKIGNSKRIYGVVQYYLFNRSGKTVGDFEVDTEWKENILNFGGRYCWDAGNDVRMWLGSGVSLINIKEKFEAFGEEVSINESATGFYLDFGDAVKVGETMEFFINFKYDFCKIQAEGKGVAGKNPDVGGLLIVGGIKFSSF